MNCNIGRKCGKTHPHNRNFTTKTTDREILVIPYRIVLIKLN